MTLDLILLGAAIALNPLPIGAYILLVGSAHGIAKGFGYVLGWVGCLALVIGLTLVLTGGRPPRPHTAPSTFGLIVRIIAGMILLALAWRQRKQTGRPKSPPKWQTNLDHLGPAAAAGIAVLLQPWTLTAAGAATISQADLATAGSVIAIVIFCVLCTGSYIVMQSLAMLRPEATIARLQGLNAWIDSHRDPVLVTILTGVGLWLIGKSAYLLL